MRQSRNEKLHFALSKFRDWRMLSSMVRARGWASTKVEQV